MTRDPATVDPERTFGHALQQMHAHGVRHMRGHGRQAGGHRDRA